GADVLRPLAVSGPRRPFPSADSTGVDAWDPHRDQGRAGDGSRGARSELAARDRRRPAGQDQRRNTGSVNESRGSSPSTLARTSTSSNSTSPSIVVRNEVSAASRPVAMRTKLWRGAR